MTAKDIEEMGYEEIAPGQYAKRDQTNRPLQPAKPEHNQEAALDKAIKGEVACVGRIKLCIICYRQRPLDPDNIYGKDIIDGLRMSKLIPNDTPWDVALEYQQVKVSKSKERTEIRITYP